MHLFRKGELFCMKKKKENCKICVKKYVETCLTNSKTHKSMFLIFTSLQTFLINYDFISNEQNNIKKYFSSKVCRNRSIITSKQLQSFWKHV